MKDRLSKNAIKESFDNLPTGICYFNSKGLLALCNIQMYRLFFELSGRELQTLPELAEALADAENKEGNVILLRDGTAWQIRSSAVKAEEEYIQFVASDVTELYRRKKELEVSTDKYSGMVGEIKKITDNLVAITREEEILTMKMHVHSKVGVCLQRLRRYRFSDDVLREKSDIVSMLKTLVDSMRGEIGNDDSGDIMAELFSIAESLGVTVELTGEIPKSAEAEKLIAEAIRESITNTLKHAEGDRIFIAISSEVGAVSTVITNNGRQPEAEVTEGGGLSSLRRKIERSGGTMEIVSLPRFELRLRLII